MKPFFLPFFLTLFLFPYFSLAPLSGFREVLSLGILVFRGPVRNVFTFPGGRLVYVSPDPKKKNKPKLYLFDDSATRGTPGGTNAGPFADANARVPVRGPRGGRTECRRADCRPKKSARRNHQGMVGGGKNNKKKKIYKIPVRSRIRVSDAQMSGTRKTF